MEQRGIFGRLARAGGKRKRKRGLADRRVRGCWRGCTLHFNLDLSVLLAGRTTLLDRQKWGEACEFSFRRGRERVLLPFSFFFFDLLLAFVSFLFLALKVDAPRKKTTGYVWLDELLEACVFSTSLIIDSQPIRPVFLPKTRIDP